MHPQCQLQGNYNGKQDIEFRWSYQPSGSNKPVNRFLLYSVKCHPGETLQDAKEDRMGSTKLNFVGK